LEGPVQYPLAVKELDGVNFQSCCEFVSLKSATGPEELEWLNGPGSLTLRGRLISLRNASFKDVVQLGPEVPKKRVTNTGSSVLPYVALKDYTDVYIIRESQLYPYRHIGWLTIDDPWYHCSKLQRDGRFLVVGIRKGSLQDSLLDTIVFGVFLIPSEAGNGLYKRADAGILSASNTIPIADLETNAIGSELDQTQIPRVGMFDPRFWITLTIT
jgi:hypothetical protein